MVRFCLERLYSRTTAQPQFEWAIALDNSGSMGIVEVETKFALVILIEVLRRLECRCSRGGNCSAL